MKIARSWSSEVPVLLCSIGVLLCGPGSAQDARVRTSLATNETVWVGQKVTVVVELLAPGYFASAATFDLPDPTGVLLMPPAERPVVSGETIDDTYYSVQRHELSAFPMRSGAQSVPAFTTRFNFKRSPLDTNEVPASVTTTAMPFAVATPPGAEGLGQVISARGLTVVETWKPEPGNTNVPAGSAFVRRVTFSAPDVPGMLFPPFPSRNIDGLGIYTKQALLDQTERGSLKGQRADTITYVCQRPGPFTLPPVRFVWFDLEAKQLRTNDLPERTLNVVANPALATAASGSITAPTPTTWWKPGALIVAVLLAMVLGFSTRLRRIIGGTLAPLRPVHLQPFNPTEKRTPEKDRT